MKLHFYKYQGTGNDFVMIDDRDRLFPAEDTALVARLCDRRFGIGADGLILLQPHTTADFYMKYYNSDGRESSMCGNGGRCIAAFARQLKVSGSTMHFNAIDGPHDAEISNGIVKLKMQDVMAVKRIDECTFELNTGSPHYVHFMAGPDPLNQLDIVPEARKIRYNDHYASDGINVNFAALSGLKSIVIRTYERGVEDETLSCGTGVTAAALSTAILNGLPPGVHEIDVKVSGGALKVRFDMAQNRESFTDIWLQGPATFVFEGTLTV